MPEEIFNSVIKDLASIGYSNIIYWHLYNEPLASLDLLSGRMKFARTQLPSACFAINTNGDFLNPHSLHALAESGLNKMFVSVYGKRHGEWEDDFIRNRVNKISEKIDLNCEIRARPGIEYSATGMADGVEIVICGRNLWKTGYDRGGLVPTLSVVRSSPCLSPFTEFLVDHQGYVLPCCNVYTDRSDHIEHTICSLKESRSDIFQAYTSTLMQQWRELLLRFNPSISFCSGCSRGEFPSENTRENNQELERLIDGMCSVDPTLLSDSSA